jgi:hypothetical protein
VGTLNSSENAVFQPNSCQQWLLIIQNIFTTSNQ